MKQRKFPHVIAIIQARMGSTRLPGKSLRPVLDRPLLSYLIERLRQSVQIDEIVVATTNQLADNAIVELCRKEGIDVYSGSEEDVLDRYYQAAKIFKADIIVRVTADCPLIDPEIVDQVIEDFRHHKVDYVSNALSRTYPRGLDVEVFSFNALEKAFHQADKNQEREHVTLYLYTHPEQFSFQERKLNPSQGQHRWTVDTNEDFILIEKLLTSLYPSNPYFRMRHILEVFEEHPEWIDINAHIQQKTI